MVFSELRFLYFFALVLGVHWALPAGRGRRLWLLAASYLFYAAWDWRFLSLIWLSTLVDWWVGNHLMATDAPRRRRGLLLLSLAVNLGLLGVFKYFDFFSASLAELLGWLGFGVHPPLLQVILPVGISFYTFQTLSYTLDIHRGRLRPPDHFEAFALFVAFFPALVAGPIVRAADFLPQIRRAVPFAAIGLRPLLVLFLVGFFKKAVVADNLAPTVDAYFSAMDSFTAVAAALATMLYAVQIYCDFSGYSDMAVACAGLLGFQLRRNFAAPYLAADITDFWRRWHISLSSWLRDYLYIPLGGSRDGRWRTYRNLLLTMLLGGLWHGASWNFVIWGGLHGVALALHKVWQAWGGAAAWRGWPAWLRHALGMVATFSWVCLAWVFFRAPTLGEAWLGVQALLLGRDWGEQSLSPAWLGVVALLGLLHWGHHRGWDQVAWARLPLPLFASLWGVAFAAALSLVNPGYHPFIYFQF